MREALEEYAELVSHLRAATDTIEHALEDETTAHSGAGGDEHLAHAKHLRDAVLPAMLEAREACDELERRTANDLWPIPTYLEMLFIK